MHAWTEEDKNKVGYGRRAASVGLLLTVCLWTHSCGSSSDERPGDILLITIDTLRADHLSVYGYHRKTSPKIDQWFADGAIFERSYATEASTSPSVASLLTGKLPQDHGIRLFFQLLPEGTQLIPDLLPSSYETAAIISNMVLTDEAMGMAKHFDHYDDMVDQKESDRDMFERNARGTTDAALRWLALDRDPKRPSFLWVHYIDPHGPYRPPADWDVKFEHDGSVPFSTDRIAKYGVLEGVTDGLTYVDRYDAEIAYVDSQVDRLLQGYGQHCEIDEALIVLTSDHGESMMEHERWFTHGYQVYEEIAHVPLLIRGPGVEAGRWSTPTSGIDVTPTILGFAGVEPPAGSTGQDLRLGGSIPKDRIVYSEASSRDRQWRSAVQGTDKWIAQVRGDDRRIAIQTQFDLASDPGELVPRPWPTSSPATASLLALIRDDPDPAGVPAGFRSGIRLDAPKVAPNPTEDQLKILRALGYAE
ncbi:MAG: arylsulfatase A-like enzyme [Planctomycetota bacterium]|jgi:arylsulfatase A-like enzyme